MGVMWKETLSLTKLQNFWLAKALMSSYILCESLRFQTLVVQKVLYTSGLYSLAELIVVWHFHIQNWFVCSSFRNSIAYANVANIETKIPLQLIAWPLYLSSISYPTGTQCYNISSEKHAFHSVWRLWSFQSFPN